VNAFSFSFGIAKSSDCCLTGVPDQARVNRMILGVHRFVATNPRSRLKQLLNISPVGEAD